MPIAVELARKEAEGGSNVTLQSQLPNAQGQPAVDVAYMCQQRKDRNPLNHKSLPNARGQPVDPLTAES